MSSDKGLLHSLEGDMQITALCSVYGSWQWLCAKHHGSILEFVDKGVLHLGPALTTELTPSHLP